MTVFFCVFGTPPVSSHAVVFPDILETSVDLGSLWLPSSAAVNRWKNSFPFRVLPVLGSSRFVFLLRCLGCVPISHLGHFSLRHIVPRSLPVLLGPKDLSRIPSLFRLLPWEPAIHGSGLLVMTMARICRVDSLELE